MGSHATTGFRTGARDLYALLGVERDASTEEITTAFRERAKALHPDRSPRDAATVERFKELSAAYATLTRPERRAAYDARRSSTTVAARERAPRSHQVLATRGRARGAVVGGLLCILLGLAITPVLLSLETSSETIGRDVTLWIVVAKLLVCGAVLVGAGWWRLATRPTARSTLAGARGRSDVPRATTPVDGASAA